MRKSEFDGQDKYGVSGFCDDHFGSKIEHSIPLQPIYLIQLK